MKELGDREVHYLWNPIKTAPDGPIDVFWVNSTWNVPGTGILKRAVRRGDFWETSSGKSVPHRFVMLWKSANECGLSAADCVAVNTSGD